MNRSDNNKSNNSRNSSSDPMDNKKDVERSNDNKIDQDFPGYPHYPAKEDMMDKRTDTHKVDMDVENLAGGQNASGLNQRFVKQGAQEDFSSTHNPEANTENDLGTKEDEIGIPQNVTNDDLKNQQDLPGSNL